MFCFNIPLGNPTEAADIVFSKFNACAVLIYCFRFLAWTFNHKMSSLFLDVFVLFWGGEPAGKLQANNFLLRNIVIKNGLLTLAHALPTFCSRLLTLCSRFAHALLTLRSRFAHALLTLAEVPFESLRGSFWVHTRACSSWGWFSNLKKKHPHATHNPSLKRGCHTPASAWDMYVQRSFWAQRIQKMYPILWYYELWHVPLEPKGPKKYIYRWYCAPFLLGPKDPKST